MVDSADAVKTLRTVWAFAFFVLMLDKKTPKPKTSDPIGDIQKLDAYWCGQ